MLFKFKGDSSASMRERVPIHLASDTGKGRELLVEPDRSLLSTLRRELALFVPSPCGGRGACGLCKVRVSEGEDPQGRLPPCGPLELPWLTAEEHAVGVRLSCQLRPVPGLTVWVPERLTAARSFRAEAEEVCDLGEGYRLVRLRLPDPCTIAFLPGQYLQAMVPESHFRDPQSGDPACRAYSIASPPRADGRLELLIRLAPYGLATTGLWQGLKPGEPIEFNGPHGEFTLDGANGDLLFVAGGSGVAPVRSMVLALAETAFARTIRLFLVAPPPRIAEELRMLAGKFPGLRLALYPSSGGRFADELAEAARAMAAATLQRVNCYLCGAPALVDRSAGALAAAGIPPGNIKVDRFG